MPTTYYTNCSPIIVNCRLYTNPTLTTYVPDGYYSNGGVVYHVTGGLGLVTSITNCPTTTQAPCTNCCFVGDTIISLPNEKFKEIKDIKVGDTILSFNESLHQIEENKVLKLRSYNSSDLIKYTYANDTTIESTSDHPFYVNGYNISSFAPQLTKVKYNFQIDVNQINIGDTVNLLDGTTTYIKSIEILKKSVEVYTFEVENNHNYYANGVLVHNKSNGCSCCYNPVTNQYLQIAYATDSEWVGCCCLNVDPNDPTKWNWVDNPTKCPDC